MHYFARAAVVQFSEFRLHKEWPPAFYEFSQLTRSQEILSVVSAAVKNGKTAKVDLRCKGHSTGSAVYLRQPQDDGLEVVYTPMVTPGKGDTTDEDPAVVRGRSQWESVTIRCFYCGRVQTRSASYGLRAVIEALKTTPRGKLSCHWMT